MAINRQQTGKTVERRRPQLLSRGRARSNRGPCASGGRVHPTIDAAHASNAPARCAIHDARDLLACCGVRVCQLPRGVHAPRERLGADIGLGLLPAGAARRRKAETLRERLVREPIV
jgi:hypothetical protein